MAVLLLYAALAGCGGSDTDKPPSAPARLTDAEQVAATIRRQMQAVARGDGETACRLFSPRTLQQVQDAVARRAGDIGCVTAVGQGAAALPSSARGALRRPVITRVEVHGNRARVSVRLPAALVALAGKGRARGGTPLRRIGGEWRVDGLAF